MPKTKKAKKTTKPNFLEVIADKLTEFGERLSKLENKTPVRTIKRVADETETVAETVSQATAPYRSDAKTASFPQATKTASALKDSKKRKFELWSYNEFGEGSIVSWANNVDSVFDAAREYVTDQNINNALSPEEKENVWEAYFPVVFENGQPSKTTLYAGNKRNGKQHVYAWDGNQYVYTPMGKVDMRFYLGRVHECGKNTEWYLSYKGKPITTLDHVLLDQKTVLFVKVV